MLAAGLVDQPLQVVPEVGLVREPAAHACLVVGLGDDRRRADRHPATSAAAVIAGRAARAEPARRSPLDPLQHAHGAHAAQHAHDHGRGDQVALVAREAGLRHRRHHQSPGGARRSPARASPPRRGCGATSSRVADRDDRAHLDGSDRERDEAVQHRQRRDGVEGRAARGWERSRARPRGTARPTPTTRAGTRPPGSARRRRPCACAGAAPRTTARARRARGTARPPAA